MCWKARQVDVMRPVVRVASIEEAAFLKLSRGSGWMSTGRPFIIIQQQHLLILLNDRQKVTSLRSKNDGKKVHWQKTWVDEMYRGMRTSKSAIQRTYIVIRL
jgi:hypothetical protein